MAVDVAELEGLRDELIRTRARGVRVTVYEGRRLEYGSDAEMAAAIADLDRRIANASRAPAGAVRFHTSKGV
ncbi:phage head-tail joining protein [Qingshengfaniella alkalisoli]|uniref:GpW protein n=1 Tax=Qingshengfaniella alkalisoli TaxID=2599296 RepID=A0A5B8IZH6_9RHOB|nr:hypothetical protein [Qingshengfaniella alkalisoli]QDY70018.1 hypothetical protein FPZ52_10570 [Qingshengfaniella alkalisoli]